MGSLEEDADRPRAQTEESERRVAGARAAGTPDLERAAFLAEVGAHLAATLDPRAALSRVARLAVPYLADWCAIDILDEDGAVQRVAAAHVDPRRAADLLALGEWMEAPAGSAEARPVGAPRGPAQVLRGGSPELRSEVHPDLLAEAATVEGAIRVRRIDCRSYLCAPLAARGQAVGAITLGMISTARRLGAADLAFVEELGRRIALSIDNARLFRRAQDAHRRAAFLAEAGAQLAVSLDGAAVLERLARIVVPALADWCAIDMAPWFSDPRLGAPRPIEVRQRQAGPDREGSGPEPAGGAARGTRVAVCHVDPTRDREIHALRPSPEGAAFDGGALQRVLREGESILLASPAPDELLGAGSRDALEALGCRSALCVPLKAHGRTFGALTLVTAESGRRLDRGDLALAEDVARRAALAVENARLYREAQDAVRLREDFLSIASHELRGPLSTMTMAAELLCDDVRTGRLRERPDGYLEMMLDKLSRQSRRLDRLIDNLLDATRITQGQISLSREDCDLVHVAREVAARAEPELERSGTLLELDLPTGRRLRGRWDRLRVEQILTNLLANAIKFGSGQPVRLSLQPRDDGGARIVVQDQGIGIAEADQVRIFERFERVESTGRPGLGLGLYIVRQLVEAHDGAIRVSSAPGRGSRFVVDLPPGLATAPATSDS